MNKGKRWITAVAAAAMMGVVPVLSADTQEERIARLERNWRRCRRNWLR